MVADTFQLSLTRVADFAGHSVGALSCFVLLSCYIYLHYVYMSTCNIRTIIMLTVGIMNVLDGLPVLRTASKPIQK